MCRLAYPKPIRIILFILCEIAISATDLAEGISVFNLSLCANLTSELLGSAIGMNLVFGLPLLFGVLLTAADTFVSLSGSLSLSLPFHPLQLLSVPNFITPTLTLACLSHS